MKKIINVNSKYTQECAKEKKIKIKIKIKHEKLFDILDKLLKEYYGNNWRNINDLVYYKNVIDDQAINLIYNMENEQL